MSQSVAHSAAQPEVPAELTAGLAHDVGNLLTAVSLLSELLLLTDPLSAIQQSYAREIQSAARRAIVLMRQLTPGMQALEPVPFCAVRLLHEMEPLIGHLCGDQVNVSICAHGTEALAYADPCHLERVNLNLAVNARDAMRQGGRLTHEARAWQVTEAEARKWSGIGVRLEPGPCVAIAIADTGCGMEPAALATGLPPFFAAMQCGGVGLGLAIAHSVVERNGGSIAIESAPGKGTRVQVVLPAAPGTSTCKAGLMG